MASTSRTRILKTVAALALAALPCALFPGLPSAQAGERRTRGLLVEPFDAERPVDLATAIMKVAKENIPAVVHIEVTERREAESPFPFGSDPFFRHFFGLPAPPPRPEREMRGIGSGMLIDAEGHILTNHHVVGGAIQIRALLADGSSYPAKVIGTDPKTDLAVVAISAGGRVPQVRFGDSDRVSVGEWVVAIGHPRGLDQTVTQGIISAKHRRGITDPTGYEDFLQTDAAINPGNSGGPLLNLHGQVIGVNAAIATQSGGYEGLGFAIPSNMAVYVARQLIEKGKVERGWIGVTVQDLTPKLARSKGLELIKGALVSDLAEGGPAQKGGLQRGDVVVGYEGREVDGAGALRNAVAETPPGREARLALIRNGKREQITIRIGDSNEALRSFAAEAKKKLGVTVRAVTPNEATKYGMEPDAGVAVATVEPEGPMGATGVEPEDLILQVGGTAVTGVESFVQAVARLPAGRKVPFVALDHRTGKAGRIEVTVR
ncbi:MAG: trypsin-like peptidase domain-containing protein [Deltaproteobacteria bacterium]|nr:trypsin-like peptidase domain-containing protein [Deltaproteobacteria bacterium]